MLSHTQKAGFLMSVKVSMTVDQILSFLVHIDFKQVFNNVPNIKTKSVSGSLSPVKTETSMLFNTDCHLKESQIFEIIKV